MFDNLRPGVIVARSNWSLHDNGGLFRPQPHPHDLLPAEASVDDLVLMRRHGDGWRLVAASLCFPSYWRLAEKFDRPLASIHALDLGFDGRLPFRISGDEDQSASFGADAALRLDIDRDTVLTASGGYSYTQDDLDYTRYGGRLRGGYAISPVLTPFVEVEVSRRVMDERPDTSGLDRNALRYALRLGTAFDRGEKLSGEVAIGYVREDIADAALADIAGLSVNADLRWSPRRETDVRFGLATVTTTSSAADTSGSLIYAANLGVQHRARANLELNGEVSVQYEDVVGPGEDTVTAAGLVGATYWFNRFMASVSENSQPITGTEVSV